MPHVTTHYRVIVTAGRHRQPRNQNTWIEPNPQSDADAQRLSALRTQLQARLVALPQVKEAAAVSLGLLRGTGTGMGFAAQDKLVQGLSMGAVK